MSEGPSLALVVVVWLGVWHAGSLAVAAARFGGVPGRLLLAALLALAHVQATLAGHVTGQTDALPIELLLTASAAGMTIGPLVYLAVRELLAAGHGLRASDTVHFVPALIQLSVHVPVLVIGPARTALLDDYIGLGLVRSFVPGVEVARALALLYLGLTAWRVAQAARQPGRPWTMTLGALVAAAYGAVCLATVFIFSADPHAWLRPVLVTAVLAVVHLVLVARLPMARRKRAIDTSQRASTARLLRGDGYQGDLLPIPVAEVSSPQVLKGADMLAPHLTAGRAPLGTKYEQSPLSDERKGTIGRRLIALMDADRAFLDPTFTLEKAGEWVGTSPRYVSQVVNETLGLSFTAFVNGYRIAEAQRLLREPALGHLTVIAIGEEAGFASKSAFYEAFKRATGTTPATYRVWATDSTAPEEGGAASGDGVATDPGRLSLA